MLGVKAEGGPRGEGDDCRTAASTPVRIGFLWFRFGRPRNHSRRNLRGLVGTDFECFNPDFPSSILRFHVLAFPLSYPFVGFGIGTSTNEHVTNSLGGHNH